VVAFVVGVLALFGGIGVAVLVGHVRPVGKPLTWGEAFVAGVFGFSLMLLAYGVIPHQWLKWADNELLWRSDKLLLGFSSAGVKFGKNAPQVGGSGRILVTYQTLRDIIVSIIYGVFLGMQIAIWKWWQSRSPRRPDLETTSKFGRPVMKEA